MFGSILLVASATLTPLEAQSLPVSELAERVLGAAGTVVVDIERPKWPLCVGLCPPKKPNPDGPPPLTAITFYTRAVATSEAGWLGICRATAIEVRFDPSGAVTDLVQRTTVGWLGRLTRVIDGPAEKVQEISAQYPEFQKQCSTLPSTQAFIPAFGPLDGERALIAVSLIHDSMAEGGPIRVTCTFEMGLPCGSRRDLLALADDVSVTKITGIEQIDARTGSFVTGGPTDRACYQISLAQSFGRSDQINVCLTVTDRLTITRAAFTRAHVMY